MRVTQLNLVGFKSFADKTRLEFPPGVTAIVGPNGCGKSNIADAIRWVFGEQRVKALRGSTMEDVIFAGTEHRHPLGMAEITLTIDNADGRLNTPFTEVSVGRRRYRSGESEYLANGALCRRQDVISIFQDTGMGLDAFSYIEQGRIDMVLSTKPEDRRHIFEDAAGIVRYRKRQAEALRKLDRTDQNLARLTDTIQEVQRRCRSLKRQASAAQRYRTLQDELRSHELRLARFQYDQAADELTARTDALRAATDELGAVGVRVNAGEAAIEQARLNQLEFESRLSHAQQAVYAIETDIDRAEAHIRVLEEKRRAAEERAGAATKEVNLLTGRAAELAELAAQVVRQVEGGEMAVAAAVAAVQAAEVDAASLVDRITAAERQLEQDRGDSLNALNDRIGAESRAASVASQIELAAGRLARVADQIRHTEQQVSLHARRLGESRTQVERLTADRTATRASLATAEEEREQCYARLAGAETELAAQRETLSAARSKLRSLEEVRDRFEGFQVGVKTVLAAKRDGAAWTSGVRGAVADLVGTDRQYAGALEAALGPYLQSIVTDGTADADRIIATLRDTGAGRITCVPLDDLRVAQWDRPALPGSGAGGVVGWATDLVTAAPAVQPAVEHLLGNTLVVETEDVAEQLAPHLTPLPRFVTLEGTVIHPTGIRSGGAPQEGVGLIGRHNEIAALAEEVTRLEGQVASRTDTIAALETELHRIDVLVADRAQQAANLNVDIRGLEQDCDRSVEALETARTQAQEVQAESRTVLLERATLLAEQDRIGQDLEALRCVEETVLARLDAAQGALNTLLVDKDTLNERLTSSQVERSASEHALAAYRREAERVEALQAETAERLDARRAEGQQAHDTCHQVDREVADTREQIQQRNLDRQAAQQTVTDLQQSRGAVVAEIGKQEQALREARAAYQQWTDHAHGLELEVTRLRDRLDGLREHILTAYQVDLAEGAELFSHEELSALAGDAARQAEGGPDADDAAEVWNPESAAQIVADLKQRLERMGPVNLIAIEEYEEYRARAEYLEQQDADLRAARQTLLDVIQRISTTIEQRFLETFLRVQEHFHDVFRLLFDGGRGRISLDDPEHPLECGIDVDVQPPGKQLQSISLLSGGERALTAAALLFAVFKTRPSPFCILDEIDAPLDDTNVIRLCRLIDRFSEQTQFIVITHNKRTMELADTLYGVTMEERGVSQVVSVRLTREPDVPGTRVDLPMGIAAA